MPAASKARMVMAFEPVNRGTATLQEVVPVAVPEPPKLLAHVIRWTPRLSVAVPLMRIAAKAVETVVPPGEVTASEGGVVSAVLGGVAGVVTRRVTAKDRET